ncbi:putative flavonoid 3'-monooxygenase [Iris pallida]|uniref:Flavonoid 3'-monooxygenase n=1 Tax=Iris pallida TaxID=29817 RepID=A0AAX6EUH5_IRIPA|nr:putative flavonoid 3'-monooxygenase [Iris pallida]
MPMEAIVNKSVSVLYLHTKPNFWITISLLSVLERTCIPMAMAISTNLNLVLTLCIPTVLFLLFIRWLKEGRSLPPGPFGLPLLGNLPFLSPDLHRCFADLSRTYGPVMTIRLGCRPCVVLSSSSAAREALRDNDLTFASHDVPAAALAAFNGKSSMEPVRPRLAHAAEDERSRGAQRVQPRSCPSASAKGGAADGGDNPCKGRKRGRG